VVTRVDASETIDAAGQLGADAAVSCRSGSLADAGSNAANDDSTRNSPARSRTNSAANAAAGASPECPGATNHADPWRPYAGSTDHGDSPAFAPGAAASSATAARP
jgi:hypothetical protein